MSVEIQLPKEARSCRRIIQITEDQSVINRHSLIECRTQLHNNHSLPNGAAETRCSAADFFLSSHLSSSPATTIHSLLPFEQALRQSVPYCDRGASSNFHQPRVYCELIRQALEGHRSLLISSGLRRSDQNCSSSHNSL